MCAHEHARPPAHARTHAQADNTHTQRHAQPRANSRVRKTPEYFFLATFKSRLVLFTSFFSGGGEEEGKEGMGWWQAHGRVNVRVRVCSLSTTCHCPPTPPPKRTKTTLCAILRSGRSSRSQPLLRTTPGGGSRFKVVFFLTPSTERAPVLSRSTKWVNNN